MICALYVLGHSEVVRLLLDQGARTSVVNNFNKTAAQLGAFVGIIYTYKRHCIQRNPSKPDTIGTDLNSEVSPFQTDMSL